MNLNLKIAFRSFIRNFRSVFLNVLGLAVGLTATILILLWILDELSFDQFHVKKDRIYQIWDTQRYSDHTFTFRATPGPLAEALKSSFPEIDETCRLMFSNTSVTVGENNFNERGVYSEQQLFKMFTFPIVKGNIDHLLPNNNSIVISEKLAQKLFPDEEAINKIIRIGNKEDFTVTGIMKDVPKNSSLQFEFVIPFSVYERDNSWVKNMGSNGVQTFITLNNPADEAKINDEILNFVKERVEGSPVELFIRLFTLNRLHSKFVDGKPVGGGIDNVRNMALIAIVVLLMAIINFMNLSTARSSLRAKEVGIKKVAGTSRKQLISQFMSESFLITLVSGLIALIFVQLLIPFYNQVTGKELVIDFANPTITFSLIGVIVITAILAGLYPSFVLSSFKPVDILKGKSVTTDRGKGNSVRKVLVVVQFMMAIVLISLVFSIFQQVKYLRGMDIGLDMNNVLTYYPTKEVRNHFETFSNEAANLPGVIGVASSNQTPYSIGTNGGITWEGMPEGETVLVQSMGVNYDFIPTMGMRILKGRNFSRDIGADSVSSVIISEELARIMGFDDPLGKKIAGNAIVIGVVSDFNSWSLYHGLNPVLIYLSKVNSQMFVKVAPGETENVINELKDLHGKYDQPFTFRYTFMTDNYNKQYDGETTIGKLAGAFTIIGIIVSCLGLIGLVSFTAERKAKEISIRKVLGASVTQVLTMMFGYFIRLILISTVISLPLSYWIITEYLTKFAYHFTLGAAIFIFPFILIIVLAFLSVFYHSRKAATTNPAYTLRGE